MSCPHCALASDGVCYPHEVHRLKCRIITLEGALRELIEYADSEFAGDGMPDSPEQERARAALKESTDR